MKNAAQLRNALAHDPGMKDVDDAAEDHDEKQDDDDFGTHMIIV
jgi:hypothetical protein